MHRIAMTLALVAGVSTTVAAADLTPGLPVRPVNAELMAPMASAKPATAPQTAGAAELTPDERRVAQGLTAPDPRPAQDPVRANIKAPPSTLTVKANVTSVFGVALGQSNRLVVPFKHPAVQTAVSDAAAEILVDASGVIYVTPKTGDPVGMFIFDSADPKNAISLTAVPASIPPVSVAISLAGYYAPPETAATTPTRSGDAQTAKGFENDQPFTETLKDVFKTLATGKVPSGYSLGSVDARNAAVARCVMPGFRIEARQLVTGFNINVVVSKLTNTSSVNADVLETGCQGNDVLAAAAWPAVRVAPGQSVELYVAVRAPSPDANDQVRPSLIGGGQ